MILRKSDREILYDSWYYDECNFTYDMPTRYKIIIDGKVYIGNSKEINLIAIKVEEGYYLRFSNPYFVSKLLNNKMMNIINKMLEINNMNIGKSNKNIINGKLFKKEVLDIEDNYKALNTYLFVFIYYWFTDLPIEYIDLFLKDKSGYKRKGITSKNLEIINGENFINGDKCEYVKDRDDNDCIIYKDFKNWLYKIYENGIVDFNYIIENKEITSTINEKGNIIYKIYNNYNLTEKPDPNLVIISEKELKEMPYEEYLQTQHWINTREMTLIRANYECQLCRSKYKLNVHHNTYENRGNEKDEDLIVLCEDCHAKHHGKK